MNLFIELVTELILRILRILPPEISSKLSLESLRVLKNLNFNLHKNMSISQSTKLINISGVAFDHYLGLSAGIDKEGKYFSALNSIGFSHIEVGTFTPLPQKGNRYPRV